MWLIATSMVLLASTLTAGSMASASLVAVDDPVRLDVETGDGQMQSLRLVGLAWDGVCQSDDVMARIQQLLGDSSSIRVELASDGATPDPDGRLPAYIWLDDGQNLGEVLLSEGDLAARRDEPHPLQDAFLGADLKAKTQHVGIWSAGACPALSQLSGFVNAELTAAQRARTAASILHDQARSAPQAIDRPTWASTTKTALELAHAAAGQLRSSLPAPSSTSQTQANLVQLGVDLDRESTDFSGAAAVGDVIRIQSVAADVDATADGLNRAFAELATLSATYGLGD